MPTCSKCKLPKELSEFHKAGDRTSGRRSRCKRCQNISRAKYTEENIEKEKSRRKRWRKANPEKVKGMKQRYYLKNREKILNPEKHLKSRYGLTNGAYQKLLADQGGVCAICKRPNKLCVDHCHTTGLVRGLLCYSCNLGIRIMEGPKELLEEAKRYLGRSL